MSDASELPVVLAATFTAEPVESALRFWMERLELNPGIQFAPFNQILQQWLQPQSLMRQNRTGVNVVLYRPEDGLRMANESQVAPLLRTPGVQQDLMDRAQELVQTARMVRQDPKAIPLLFLICPPSPGCSEVASDYLLRLEKFMVSELNQLPGVHAAGATELSALYPVQNFYDADTDRAAHIPYTGQQFTAIAAWIARKIRNLRSPAVKVIAVDADRSLWGEVVGEVGAQKIQLDPGHLHLQRLLLDQQSRGRLLCLVSKNREQDVWEVFDQRPEMILKREHFVAHRINWQPKPANLRELARELNLGLDSFAFIDDNPAECARVRAECPGVQVLQLPASAEKFADVLRHFWPLDVLRVTDEDRARTRMYRENLDRERFQQTQNSWNDFLEGLQLRVDIQPLEATTLSRAAQLTERTNQFNTTTRRRNETDLAAYHRSERFHAVTVHASDRFGDYGMVGLMLFQQEGAELWVDSLLLSCRALGKGIEHQMLRFLGSTALSVNASRVVIPAIPTARNQPAFQFLESLPRQDKVTEEVQTRFLFSSATLSTLATLDPQSVATQAPGRTRERSDAESQGAKKVGVPGAGADLMNEIAHEQGDLRTVLGRILAQKRKPRPALATPYVRPITTVERWLAAQWSRILDVQDIGLDDHFFELGGQSIQAVYAVNVVQRRTGHPIHVATLFSHPTLRQFLKHWREERPTDQTSLEQTLLESGPDDEDPTISLEASRGWRWQDPEEARMLSEQLDQLSDDDVDRIWHEIQQSSRTPQVGSSANL